jgi:AraC-like DNA-binding protein
MEEFTVGSAEVRALVGSLGALGLNVPLLQRVAEIEPSALEDPEARFPESRLLALWLAAEASWDRGLLGLHAGANVPVGAFEVLDYLAGASPTLGGGLRRLAEYSAIANTGLTYAIDDGSADAVVVSMRHPYAFEFLPPSFVEYLWTLIVTRFRDQVDARFRPRLALRHAPQGPLATYRDVLGDVVFHAERSELRIPREQWDLPNPRNDAALTSVLERHARDLLARLPVAHDPLDRVRSAMHASLREGNASIERVAARLHVAPRTLQRQLAAAGSSFKAALDAMRGEIARALLSSSARSLVEITYLLGYSDPSAFNRAFRRWTGATPLEYRLASGRASTPPGAQTAPGEAGSVGRPPLRAPSGPPPQSPPGDTARRRTAP